MTTSYDDAVLQARAAADGMADSLVAGIAERVGSSARAAAVFGEPVHREGVTVIPVAKVRWGFGGGGGTGKDGDQGGGGGGGANANPLGYIEVTDRGAQFVRIKDPAAYVPMLLAGAFAFWLAMRSLRALFH